MPRNQVRRQVPILSLIALALFLPGPVAGAANTGTLKTFKIKSGGYERLYRVYAPGDLDSKRKYPLLVLLHGGGGTGEGMVRLARGGFEALADRHGALLAYPDGVDKNWNDYRGDQSRKSQRENIDDVAFLSLMLDKIAAKYPLDTSRVYASGISNGAMMSYALACRAAGRFAAIAPVAGTMPENLAAACRPGRPVPVLMIGGTEDNLVHWNGGHVTGPFGKKKLGKIISVEKSRDFWLANNSCDKSRKKTRIIDSEPDDGTSVTREVYPSCAGQSSVEFFRVEGGGHTWPGGLQYMPKRLIGRTSRELDANTEIWGFLMKQSLTAKLERGGKMSITVTSPEFKHNDYIPAKYTCSGEDVSPPLKWDGVPSGTKSLAVIMDDPDAPPGTWVHWVLFDIPAGSGALPEDLARKEILPDGSRHGLVWGVNEDDFSRIGYYGPCPPPGRPHRYFFKVYALDKMLGLPAGISKGALLDAMEGHVLAHGELVGLYKR